MTSISRNDVTTLLAVRWLAAVLLAVQGCSSAGVDAGAARAPAVVVPELRPVHLRADLPYRAQDHAFLRQAIGERSIVQLGESLHITDEFPRVRLRFVRYLHAEMGFDVLAIEGSAIDAWLANERAYDEDVADVAGFQRTALFAVWQSAAMRDLVAHVLSTRRSPRPLYLTSFDVQPGTSARFIGLPRGEVLLALVQALARYAPPPDAREARRWADDISPFFRRYGATSPLSAELERRALEAIAEMESWMAALAPAVRARRPAVHVAALRLIPDVLRAAVDLAQASGRAGSESQRVYRETRDRLSARNVLRLHDAVSPGRRVLVWAHHSHVIHDSTGRNVDSMGRSLLAAVPDRLYTIGLFAGGGAAATLRADGRSVSVTALAPPPHPSVERLLASLAPADYFVDLSRLDGKSAAHAAWFAPLPSRQEPDDTLDTAVARDFHGAVFIRQVHPPRMLLPSPAEASAPR